MHQHKSDMTTLPGATRAAELINCKGVGFAERFGAFGLIETGATVVGGSLTANPIGDLKAKAHPPGATDVAQCVESFQQLRGHAANQVGGTRIALAHNIGGPTAVSAETILEGPGTNGG
jgi:acetyl-CoA C-acetyltransferase